MSVRGDRNTNSTLNTVNVSSRVRCKDARETPNFIELFVPCNQHIAMNGLEKKNNKKIHSRKPRNRHSRLLFQARAELSMWDTCFSLRLRSYQSVCLACSVLMCPWIILINAIPVYMDLRYLARPREAGNSNDEGSAVAALKLIIR